MPVGEVTVRLNLNKDGYSAGMTEARRQAQQTAKTIEGMGHATVTQMQAASASIRVLEGGMTGNIRAAERFISTIPGVGKALQAAFPVVGAIAFAGVIARIGEEAATAIRKVEQAEQNVGNSFRSLNLSAQGANDALAVTNDRLENEIAKLQGKPQNNLALAIDEARVAADKMAESLDRDNQKIKELLSQNAVPWWAGLLGKAGTSNVSDTLNAQNQHLSDLANRRNIATHSGNTDEAERLSTAIDAMRSQYLQANADEIQARLNDQKKTGGLNQGANISLLQGQQSSLFNQFDQESELARNQSDEAVKQKLDAAKALNEAQKQAQELIVKGWRDAFDETKADDDLTLAQEAQWWNQRVMESRKGSLSYIEALDETNKLIAEMRGQNMRGGKAFDATSAASYLPDSMDLFKGDTGAEKEQGRAAVDYLKSLNESIALQEANRNAIAESAIAMGVLTGTLSKLDAAQLQAALHAKEYKDAIDSIDQAVANAQNLPDSLDKQATIVGLKNQRSQVGASYQIQSAQDQQGIASQQLGPATQQALGTMVNQWGNMTTSIVAVMTKAIDSFNDDIAKAITGHGSKADFGKTLSQAGEGLVKTGLQKGESAIMGAFGLGKPDGSRQNPFYTIAAAGMGASSSIGLSSPARTAQVGLQDLVPGGSFIQPFISALPHFAGGGDVTAGNPIMVGENGPEPFIPRTSGTILPNSALGGSTGHTFNIDARGSNDPAAIHAAVMRAAPHIIAASVQTQHHAAKRKPQGR